MASARRRRRGIVLFVCMAILVSFGVERLLRQQGITLTGAQQVLDCQETRVVAHTHNADCYDQDGNLVCPLPERPYHVHGSDCYANDGSSLVCGLEETVGEHVHGPDCFRRVTLDGGDEPEPDAQGSNAVEPNRSSSIDASSVNVASVYESDAVEPVDSDADDKLDAVELRNDAIVEEPAGNELAVESVDDDAARPAQTFHHDFEDADGYVELTVDVDAPEGALPAESTMRANWIEKSEVDDDLVQNAIDKLPNGVAGKVLDLQAVDITFEGPDGNEVEPGRAVTVRFASRLIENSGDRPNIVHVEDIEEARERAEAQGKNPKKAKVQGEVVKTLSAQELAMRDEGLEADQVAFKASQFSTYVLALTSQQRTLTTSDDVTLDVTINASAAAGIPAEAMLEVKEIEQGTRKFEKYQKKALDAMGSDDVVALARFFDIRIVDADGEAIQPAEDVNVKISLADAPAADLGAEASVVHFGDEPEVVASREEDGTAQFEASSFSVYGVLYTVDFVYEDHEYTLPGGGTMLLSELFKALHIEADLADVESVEFSNPDVLSVERADVPTTVERLTKVAYGMEGGDNSDDHESTDPAGELVAEPLAEGEDFEEPPALTETIDVAEGDWIFASKASFETPETLKVLTKDTLYEIAVTDPPNPWGPGFGFFGGTATWDLKDLKPSRGSLDINLQNANANDEYDVGEKLAFDITYLIKKAEWSNPPQNYNPWLGYPTFTYDFGEALKNGKFITSIKPHKSYLYFGGKKRGTLEVTADGKITIQVTDMNWFNSRDEIGGSFNVEVELTATKDNNEGNEDIDFPGPPGTVTIKKKKHVEAVAKTIDEAHVTRNDSTGEYTIPYTASFKVDDDLTSLKFVDTFGGQQTLDGTVTVKKDGSDYANVTTAPTANGFETTFNGAIANGTYTVAYQTKVSGDVYTSLQNGGSDWSTKNTCEWVYDGDKRLSGGDTTYEIKRPAPNPPTLTKTSNMDGKSVDQNGTIDYILTITGSQLAGMNLVDNMTDLQVIQDEPAFSVKVNGVEDAGAAEALKSAVYKYNDDGNYNEYTTPVLNGSIPESDPFNNAGKNVEITITYATKVIDQETASAASVYGQKSISNTLSENWTWQNKTTTSTVTYKSETVTKVSKSDSHTMTDHGTYEGATLDKSKTNEIPDGVGIITYTITVGDGTTLLDGVRVTDTASGDQQIIKGSYRVTGSDVSVNAEPAYLSESPLTYNQTAFDFTFPAGTGTGPVTIEYQAKPYDGNAANEAGIYGKRTFTNAVKTSTDEDAVAIDYEYPDKTPFNVVKKATENKTENPNEGDSDGTLDPGETVDYEIIFGSNDTTVDGLSIMDEMTALQKLTGDVKVEIGTYNGTTFTAKNDLNGYVGTIFGIDAPLTIGSDGSFTMPKASNGWADNGVTWEYFSNDINENMVRVFNFKFPDFKNGDSDVEVKGAVRVTYTTQIISRDEAASVGITGSKTAKNAATSNEVRKEVEVHPEFPKNLNHNADVSKSFSGWDDDGYTTWWDIDVFADEESTYPLEDLILTEDWASGSVYYSTDWPVQNYAKNSLADFDLLGATVTTSSGTVLQPGRDYTIDKEAGSFKFKKLSEGVTIHLGIRNPDATINTFYQHNQVKLRWKKDAFNTGEETTDATARRVKQEVDLTKTGSYDEETGIITWKVIFNPYSKPVVPEWNKIEFVDTLAKGLELTDKVKVEISGAWVNYEIDSSDTSRITTTPNADGTTTIKIGDLDPHERWGSTISDTKYYKKTGDDWTEIQSGDYHEGDGYKKVENIGLGLSGNNYNITYKTKVTDEQWKKITSSLTGRETFQNDIELGNGDGKKFTASNKVTVEADDYLIKRDVTKEDADGYVIDDEEMHDNVISYEVEVNPHKLTLYGGDKTLTLTDRIDTLMELDTDSVKICAYEGTGENEVATELSHVQLANMGISISYNDDTRQLAIAGIPDERHFKVAYSAVSRAYGFSTFNNTATLVGGGSHSDKVSDQHGVTNDGDSFWGNRHPKVDLKKIDENDITNKLNGAKFELYKVNLKNSDETKKWTCADWMDLLAKIESKDEAVLAQIKKDFVQVGEPVKIGETYTSGTNPVDGLPNDSGMLQLEYEVFPNPTIEDDTGTYLQEHTVYFWRETEAPDGYKITNAGNHYFTLYLDGELDDDYTQEDQRKKAAWALDDAVSIANDWTVASMASDTEWKVNNTRKGLTSITATKRWEGDYDNTYETRPENGILFDLYRVDKSSGKQTKIDELSNVPINVDEDGYWPTFTWYNLDDAYDYTVKEHPVSGYITSYSDKGEGQEGGTITVTNTFVPKSTDIYVEKRWDPADKPKPTEVKVTLYRIAYETGTDGVARPGKPESMGDDFTTMLTASNNWKYVWKGLDTKDPDGNMIAYTVVEDLKAVNDATGLKYGAIYSDGSEGVVTTDEDDPLIITNQENAPGSLKISKNVTVNGESVSDTAADGVYTFRLMRVNDDGTEEPAYHVHDHSANCRGAAHEQYLVKQDELRVEIKNGKAASVMVDNLDEGTYYVQESTPGNGAKVSDPANNKVELKVVAGVTSEEIAPEAMFTNNMDRNRVEVTKKWAGSEGGATAWPAGMEVQVTLMVKEGDTLTPATVSSGDNSVWLTASKVTDDGGHITSNGPTYLWDNLPDLDDSNKSYVVVETGIRNGETSGHVADDHESSDITVDNTRRDYKISSTSEMTENGKGIEYTLTNKQVTSVTFRKQWGIDGADSWPSNVNSITVQLYKDGDSDGQPVELTAENVMRQLNGLDTTGYLYTFTGLESGHTYTVKETSVKVNDTDYIIGASNNPYLSQQIDGTTIRNVPVKTNVNIKKVWKDAAGETVENWPKSGSENLVITGALTRERRPYGSTSALEWAPDDAYNASNDSSRTFTISSAGGASPEVDKYGYVENALYEYRYTATEDGVTAGNDTLTSSFEPAFSRKDDVLTITNTPTPTSICLQKKWVEANGTTPAAWPQEGGAPVSVEFKIEQRVGNDGSWTVYKKQTVSNGGVITVYDLPKYGFDSNGKLAEYQYQVEETVPAGYEQSGDVTGDGSSTNNPFVITNKPEVTSVAVTKAWQGIDGNSAVWPDGITQVTGHVKRERRTYGSNDDWAADPWAGEQFTIAKPSGSDPATTTVSDLPTNGYDGGVHYEYRYSTAVEDPVRGYESRLETTNAGTEQAPSYSHAFTNKKTDTDIDVTVQKKWLDADGEPITGTEEAGLNSTVNPQFQLHRLRYANIIVNVTGKDGNDPGSVMVNITDESGNVVGTKELTGADYNPTAGAWQYIYSPLDTSKTYSVTATGDGTVIGTLSTSNENANLSGDTTSDYTINYTAESQPRTITVSANPGTSNGWISVNLFDDSWKYLSTVTLNSGNDWTQSFTGLDNNVQYKLQTGRIDRTVFDDAVAQETPTYSGNNGTATVTTTLAQDPRLTITEPNLVDWTNGDAGWIDIDVYQNGNTIAGSPFRIDKDTAWDFYKNLDGFSTYEVKINDFNRNVFSNVIIANGSGTFTGVVNKEVTLQATKVASSDSIAVTVNWPENSFDWAYLQWQNFNPANQNGDNSFSQSWNGSFGGSVTKTNSGTISKQQAADGGNYDYYMCYFDWNVMQSNPTKIRLTCNTTIFDPNGTEIDGSGITESQWVVFKGDISTLTIDFIDSSTNQVLSMIPFNLWLPCVAFAEEAGSVALVDETIEGNVPLSDMTTGTKTWTGLAKVDENNHPIKYYVVETSPTSGFTTTYDKGYDGEHYVYDTAMGQDSANRTITVTNQSTEASTTAKVKVRKIFKDSAGNTLTESDLPSDVNPTFTLKRLKIESATTTGIATVFVNPAQWHHAGSYSTADGSWNSGVQNRVGLGHEVSVAVTGVVVPRNSITIYLSAGASNDVETQLNQYTPFKDDLNYTIPLKNYSTSDGNTVFKFDFPASLPSGYDWATYSDGSGTKIYLAEIFINDICYNSITDVNTTISGESDGNVNSTTTIDRTFNEALNLSQLQFLNSGQYWESAFTASNYYPLSEGSARYVYYVEESDVPSYYEASYSVGGIDVTVPTDSSPNGTGWLTKSGTVTITNTDTRARIKVRKRFVDSVGNPLAPNDVTDTVTFNLKRYKARGSESAQPDVDFGGSGSNGVGESFSLTPSSFDQSSPGGWAYDADTGWFEKSFSPMALSEGDYTYTYYVEESGLSTDDYEVSYSVDGQSVNPSSPNNWLTSSGDVEITNRNYKKTSISVEKRWRNGNEDTSDAHKAEGHTATFTLYRKEIPKSASNSIAVTTDSESGLVLPQGIDKTADKVTDAVITNPIILTGDESEPWNYTWSNLPAEDANHNYKYFVEEETSTGTGTSPMYKYEFVDGETADDAPSGVVKAIVTNQETSVTVQKRWEDAVTGANTTASHAGDSVQVKLYYTTDPLLLIEDTATGSVLPTVKHAASSMENAEIHDTVTLDSSVTWTHTWTELPLRYNGHDVYYYVEEVMDEGDNPLASYAYTFNTVDDKKSGVQKAVITNKETNVAVTKDWMTPNAEGVEVNSNIPHRGQTVTLELWRALKEHGARTGNVGIAKDPITSLAFPADGNGAFASYERFDTQVVGFDMGGLNWNYRWTNLPLVVVRDDKVYDAVYFVREAANSEGAVCATYDTTYNNMSYTGGANPSANEAVWMSTGVRSVAITNHETSVSATKTWDTPQQNTAHQGATVTLDLWKAAKAPSGTTGEWSIVEDSASATDSQVGNAFPQNIGGGGGYVTAQRVDRKTVKYGTADGHANEWYAEWDHLPTHESFNGVTYELIYFVREAYTTENGTQYPASATYTPTYNTAGRKDSGVKSVAILNHDTSVTAQKVWQDQDGQDSDVKDYHKTHDDMITYELWKAHVHEGGNYGIGSVDTISYLQFPQPVSDPAAQGKYDEPALVDTQRVAHGADDAWQYEWTNLPVYEVVDGITYKNAYFVREKSVYTDGAEYSPSPTYGYGSLSGIETNGVNGGTVTVTNHETRIDVAKTWVGFDGIDTSGFTAKFRIYRARKATNNDGAYEVGNIDGVRFPVKAASNNGSLINYEQFREDKTYPDDVPNGSTTVYWDNLPLYEVDPVTGKTFEYEYFVREIETKSGNHKTKATYSDEFYNTGNDSAYQGLKKVSVTNTRTEQKSISVEKHWTGGNTGHQGVDVKLQQSTDGTNWNDVPGKFVTLEDANDWKHVWDGLRAKPDGSNDYYHYRVVEAHDGRTDFEYTRIDDGTEAENEGKYPRIEVSKQDWQDNIEHPTYYFSITNKPLYYGKLKLSKNFSLEKNRDTTASDEAEFNDKVKNDLQFEITTVDTELRNITREYQDDQNDWHTKTEQELVRATWYLVHPEANHDDLVWVQKPVQNYNYVATGPDTRMEEPGSSGETIAKDETDADYKQRLTNWQTNFDANYTYVTYADLLSNGGEFQILDSTTHLGKKSENTLSDHLHADRTYNVREINPDGIDALEQEYTLVADASVTSGSEAPPYGTSGLKSEVGETTITLSNTYRKVTGSITVTKDVTVNGGDKYDDVAAGKTFKIGLEKWDESQHMWIPLYREVSTTTEYRLPNGDVTEVTTTTEQAVLQEVTIGKGSTASVTFDGLDLGRYRAFEVADNGMTPIHKQDEAGTADGVGLPINGYQWEVSETGTYYTYEDYNGNYELRKVDGTGTYHKVNGDWVKVDGEAGEKAVTITDDMIDGTEGVELAAGSEKEKAPRNAELVITNNKTETGSITVDKSQFYNNAPDTHKKGQTVRFGLYSDATARIAVDDPNREGEQPYIVEATLNAEGKGEATFSGLAYDTMDDSTTPPTRTPNKYYVFELDKDGNPIQGGSGAVFDDGKTYTVVGGGKALTLDHDNRERTSSFVNSLKELGSIKVTKKAYQTDGTTLDADAAGKTFKIGLFTKDGSNYALVKNRILTVTIGKASDGSALAASGTGEATFANLDFDSNPTYYVFELDEKNNPIIPTDTEGSDKLGDDYEVSYPHAGASAAFTLTAEQHDFTAEYSEQGTAANAGAVVQNTALVTSADFTIKKVDKRTYAAANPESATPLQGAEFTLTQIDEKVALSSGGEVSIKTGGETRTVASDEQGIVSFKGIPGGWYEVKETKTPTGYVIVGNSTFYVKIANRKAVMLEKGTGAPETWSDISTPAAMGDSNILQYEPATTGQNAAPATVTVGNNAGAELPSTGGPGTVGLTALGLFLLASSLALLRRRHQAR